MDQNPYQPPTAPTYQEAASRKPFILAAVGAWLAAAYWGVMTLLIALTVHGADNLRALLPLVLVGLYIVRGAQVYKGDPAAASRLLWLHVVGAIFAAIQMASPGSVFLALQGIKVAINLFGAATAYGAHRSARALVGR